MADKGIHYDDAKIAVDFNPLSCFSESKTTGANFAHSGVNFHIDVPKTAIAFTHLASPGHADSYKGEQEMTVMCAGPTQLSMHQLGGATGAKIFNYFHEKGLTGAGKTEAKAPKEEPKAPPIKVKINAAMDDLEAVAAKVGAKVLPTKSSSGWEPNLELPAHKVEEFAEHFTKTNSFDAKTKTKEGLVQYLKSKASSEAAAAKAEAEPVGGAAKESSMWSPPGPSKPQSMSTKEATEKLAKAIDSGKALDVAGEEDKQATLAKSYALKAMGYQPNKKNLTDHEQKILDTAMKTAAEEHGQKIHELPKDALKAAIDKHVQKAVDEHGALGESERMKAWKKGYEQASSAMETSTVEPTEASTAAIEGELKGQKPPQRHLWWEQATQMMKKQGVPKEQHKEMFEKVQQQAKHVFAKQHLKGQKLSKFASLAVLKKIALKESTKK
jgi:hypothetical protein